MRNYSIVVPLHNEEENVTALYAQLKHVMEQVGGSFELVLVDDGSTDRTYHLLREIAAVDSRVLVVRLRRNFGQTSALAVGFDHASGEFILAMDGDLQHDPNDIPKFLKKLEEGYDIVSGWRKDRIDNLILRRIPSRCANWLKAKLSGVGTRCRLLAVSLNPWDLLQIGQETPNNYRIDHRLARVQPVVGVVAELEAL
jgi:glycosyltransferase involved in cell wall biosynthesis